MVKANKSIIFFTKHSWAGPSSRYRIFQYQKFYSDAGFIITNKPLFPNSYVATFYEKGHKPLFTVLLSYLKRFWQLTFMKKYDIVYVQYELFPFLPFFFEWIFLRNKKNLVLDYDDAVFHNYDKSPNKIIKKILGSKIFKLVKRAECVITGSPYLTKILSTYTNKVIEIPTSISFQKYNNANAIVDSNVQDVFIIGWIGSKTTSVNLLPLKQCFIQLQKQYNIQLALIGFDHLLVGELDGINYMLYDWSADTEVKLLSSFHVGIMPLTPDVFNNGKCGFKLIQYMACGLPTISTPLEANKKINRSGNNLHAVTVEEWYNRFVKMMSNRSFYKKVGDENKRIAQELYSIEANHLKYISIFNGLVGGKKG